MSKRADRLKFQNEKIILDIPANILILIRSSVLQAVCENNVIKEEAVMWLLHYFMKKTPPVAFLRPLFLKPARSVGSTDDSLGTLGWNLKIASYLFATYAASEVIAKNIEKILSLRQCLRTTAASLALALYEKVL